MHIPIFSAIVYYTIILCEIPYEIIVIRDAAIQNDPGSRSYIYIITSESPKPKTLKNSYKIKEVWIWGPLIFSRKQKVQPDGQFKTMHC